MTYLILKLPNLTYLWIILVTSKTNILGLGQLKIYPGYTLMSDTYLQRAFLAAALCLLFVSVACPRGDARQDRVMTRRAPGTHWRQPEASKCLL
jgi:hypothetical protein